MPETVCKHNCLVCAVAVLLTRQRVGEGVHMDNSDLTTAADMDVAIRFVTDFRQREKGRHR